ncbi:hypothetical protein [Vibrio sp. T20]|uniref:hypothetical protein n=1 Tax=Vibrio sp. T20 TaxID=2588450 RepID=UPI0011B4191F|nr:hypothetical protein [Vibrio sp. T20]
MNIVNKWLYGLSVSALLTTFIHMYVYATQTPALIKYSDEALVFSHNINYKENGEFDQYKDYHTIRHSLLFPMSSTTTRVFKPENHSLTYHFKIGIYARGVISLYDLNPMLRPDFHPIKATSHTLASYESVYIQTIYSDNDFVCVSELLLNSIRCLSRG